MYDCENVNKLNFIFKQKGQYYDGNVMGTADYESGNGGSCKSNVQKSS
nr:MAG TPA: hypothetical protein [Caudoviricetes sp.]